MGNLNCCWRIKSQWIKSNRQKRAMNHDCYVLPKKWIRRKYHSAIFLTEFKTPNHPSPSHPLPPPPPLSPFHSISQLSSKRAGGRFVQEKYVKFINYKPHCHSCAEQSLSNDRIYRKNLLVDQLFCNKMCIYE